MNLLFLFQNNTDDCLKTNPKGYRWPNVTFIVLLAWLITCKIEQIFHCWQLLHYHFQHSSLSYIIFSNLYSVFYYILCIFFVLIKVGPVILRHARLEDLQFVFFPHLFPVAIHFEKTFEHSI